MGAESFDRVHERERERRRREAQEAAQRKLVDKAERAAKQVFKHVIAEYEPEEIYLAGSLVDSDRFTEISDIDIAISGLSPEELEEVSDWAEEKSSYPVDILDLDRAEQLHIDSIRRSGRRVYPE
ncbi:MAG: nucleotidyltransferase domain-containing protein [Alkalispirochaetaceae bacterium]